MSQNTRRPEECDVDHKRLYKVPGFKPVGVTVELELVLGDGYLLVTYTGDCPRCGRTVRVPLPARVAMSPIIAGDPVEDVCRIAELLA